MNKSLIGITFILTSCIWVGPSFAGIKLNSAIGLKNLQHQTTYKGPVAISLTLMAPKGERGYASDITLGKPISLSKLTDELLNQYSLPSTNQFLSTFSGNYPNHDNPGPITLSVDISASAPGPISPLVTCSASIQVEKNDLIKHTYVFNITGTLKGEPTLTWCYIKRAS